MRRLLLAAFVMGCGALQAQGDPVEPRVPYIGLHLHRADQGTAWPAAGFGSWRLWDANVAWPNLEP